MNNQHHTCIPKANLSRVFLKYTKLAVMPTLASESLLCENQKFLPQ